MKKAFTESAMLEMKVASENISFPAKTTGLAGVTEVLVQTFAQNYENVYTFCVTDSVESEGNTMACNWLVSMSGRDDGRVRVGYGRYGWQFTDSEPTLVTRLDISIEQMIVLPPDSCDEVFAWLADVPYPFCDSEALITSMPSIELLRSAREYL